MRAGMFRRSAVGARLLQLLQLLLQLQLQLQLCCVSLAAPAEMR